MATFSEIIEKVNRNRKAMLMQNGTSNCETGALDKNQNRVRGTYDLSDEELERHSWEISKIERLQDGCRGCDGSKCHMDVRGMIPVVTAEDGRFYAGVKMCRWERSAREQRKRERLFQSAGVPYCYKNDTFNNYTVTNYNRSAVSAAKWAIQAGLRQGLYIHGVTGVGKTKLAAIIANAKAADGQQVLFSSVPELLADIRNSYERKTTAETISTANDIPCLILDDFGAERLTEWVGEQLFCLLNHRYNGGLQTIITSNYSPDALRDRLSMTCADDTHARRIVSRICGMCQVVEIGGRDMRI